MTDITDAETGVRIPFGPITFRKKVAGDWTRVVEVEEGTPMFQIIDISREAMK